MKGDILFNMRFLIVLGFASVMPATSAASELMLIKCHGQEIDVSNPLGERMADLYFQVNQDGNVVWVQADGFKEIQTLRSDANYMEFRARSVGPGGTEVRYAASVDRRTGSGLFYETTTQPKGVVIKAGKIERMYAAQCARTEKAF